MDVTLSDNDMNRFFNLLTTFFANHSRAIHFVAIQDELVFANSIYSFEIGSSKFKITDSTMYLEVQL